MTAISACMSVPIGRFDWFPAMVAGQFSIFPVDINGRNLPSAAILRNCSADDSHGFYLDAIFAQASAIRTNSEHWITARPSIRHANEILELFDWCIWLCLHA